MLGDNPLFDNVNDLVYRPTEKVDIKCPYCGNTVFAGNGKMKLAKKRMIEQRRGY